MPGYCLTVKKWVSKQQGHPVTPVSIEPLTTRLIDQNNNGCISMPTEFYCLSHLDVCIASVFNVVDSFREFC